VRYAHRYWPHSGNDAALVLLLPRSILLRPILRPNTFRIISIFHLNNRASLFPHRIIAPILTK
jgi:hypothetical protein